MISQVMTLGQQTYSLCMSCHGVHGEGVELLGPPLAGSEWVLGPAENLIRIQFRGLTGPIMVKGEEWNGVMVANAPTLKTDERIAAVLTYIRKSWGNNASIITPQEVSSYRTEIGKPMLTVQDLTPPLEKPSSKSQELLNEEAISLQKQNVINYFSKETISSPSPESSMDGADSPAHVEGLIFSLWVGICLIPVVIGIANRSVRY